jgi:hypothetical protein
MGADETQPGGGPEPSFFAGENVWILVPLMALSIPILAITLSNDAAAPIFAVVIAVVALIAAVTFAVRNVVGFRHRLRLQELAAQERLAQAERERFRAAERMLGEPDPDLVVPPVPPVPEAQPVPRGGERAARTDG